jgi:hypothetical protein
MHFRHPGAQASIIGLAALLFACEPFHAALPIGVQPSLSPVGVALSVPRVSCSEEVDLDANLVDAIVDARIDNRSAASVIVRRDAFRLVASDGQAIPISNWDAASPVEVPARASKNLQLLFSTRGGFSCDRPMRLEPSNAARQGARTVYLPPVSFRPGPG